MQSSQVTKCIDDYFNLFIFICRQKPLIKKQYVFAKNYWPTTFHKDNILESKLDGTFFTEKQIDQITAVFVRAEMEKGVS